MTGTVDSKAKAIFGDAMELDPSRRAGFVEAASAGDGAVRARVEALIAAATKEDGFLSPVTVDAPVSERPGASIGRYRLVEQIGEGGFGVVFMAEQERPVRRLVALKIIKLGMDTKAVIARFEQERQALALMDHPNIARVLDAGAAESGRPYFVMDLVKGEPITDYADRRSLPVRERLGLFQQVCGAIQHAHIKGIIHRDIKPSNIIVSEHDGRPLARVIDFGIAKATGLHLTERTLVTGYHQLIGTPAYMSPEQAAGSLDVDTRSDVYSLGVLLYELLTGVTPLDAASLRSAPFGELQRMIRDQDPPTPSTRLSRLAEQLPGVAARRGTEPRRLGALLRADLDWIVMKALEKDRTRRYDSPGNLAADVERSLAGKAVEAAPPGVLYRVRKFTGRHKGAVIAASLVSAALLLGAIGTSVGMFRARTEAELARQSAVNEKKANERATQEAADAKRSAQAAEAANVRATAEAEKAKQSARVAQSANALIAETMQRANRARQGGRADVTVREVMDDAARELDEHPGSHEPAVEHALAHAIGETYRELNLFEPAERMLRLEARRAAEVYGDGSLELGEAMNDLGGLLKERGKGTEAGELYKQARVIFEAAGPEAGPRLAILRINNAALLASLDRRDEAEAELHEVVAYYEREKTFPRDYYTALKNLAAIGYERGRAAPGIPLMQRVLEYERREYGDDDARTLVTLHGLTVLQASTGDPGAEASLRAELAATRRLRGEEHIDVASALNTLAVILIRKGDRRGAVEAYHQSIAITQKVLGPEHRQVASREVSLTGLLIDMNENDEAERTVRHALATLTRPGGAGPAADDTVIGRYYLGTLLLRRGALSEAEQELREAIAAAGAPRRGEKHEWAHHAMRSLLGAVLVEQAGQTDARDAKLDEAESLMVPAVERMIEVAGMLGPRSRMELVPAAIDRCVRLFTVRNQVSPSPEAEAEAKRWQEKKEAFERSGGKPSP